MSNKYLEKIAANRFAKEFTRALSRPAGKVANPSRSDAIKRLSGAGRRNMSGDTLGYKVNDRVSGPTGFLPG